MRLDKNICLGGRYNGKMIRRIKYNGYVIYPNTYSEYNIYEVEILRNNTTIYLDAINRTNLPQVPFYDFGDGVVNPTVGSTTILGEVYVTYTYEKAGLYQVRTSDFLHLDNPNSYLVKSIIALTSDLKDASHLCGGFTGLTSFENAQIDSLDRITTMEHMFSNCENLETVIFTESEFPNLNTMELMFSSCNRLETVDFSYCDLSGVSDMGGMFQSCDRLKTVNFSHCNLSNITDLSETFFASFKCSAENIDFSHCDLSGLTTLENAFYLSPTDTIDLSNANLSNVTSLRYAFQESYIKNLNLSGVILGNITDMSYMFSGCSTLKEIDLSMLDTSNVSTMLGLFSQCPLLESVDIRNFDLLRVGTLNEQQMFADCPKLHTIYMNNCNYNTIRRIINSYGFPTGEHPEGVTRKIYCKQTDAAGLTEPDGWDFIYVN